MNKLFITALLMTSMVLSACGSKPSLITRPDPVPAGLDLTGQWVQTETSGVSQPGARETGVHVFYKTGDSLKITQTNTGIFVSFDRSVVEEYQFGENRIASIGEIKAERASGWAENGYIIETLDDDGALLIDTYRLRNQGESLRRTVLLQDGSKQLLSLQIDYDRAWQ
ncbi:MAG: hypothetical protein ACR2QS_06300 [Woeseiaceae bacterium]